MAEAPKTSTTAPLPDIPLSGLKAYIADLARHHGIAYAKTGSSALAEEITRLAGDDIKPDETEIGNRTPPREWNQRAGHGDPSRPLL